MAVLPPFAHRLKYRAALAPAGLRSAWGSLSSSASRVRARLSEPRLFDVNCTLAGAVDSRALVYLPWMPTHGDALLESLSGTATPIFALPFFREPGRLVQRQRINRFVCDHPDLFHALLQALFSRIAARVAGVVFSHDWPPAMRQTVLVCRERGIPTLLIPHEAVFADRERYYRDRITGADVPVCDRVLCWGALQRDVFVERGYPEARIARVGSPKLDAAIAYTPLLERAAFCAHYALDPSKPIVLLALQPLDSQRDPDAARRAQVRAVRDALALSEKRGFALIVRFPPSGHDLLPFSLVLRLLNTRDVALDVGPAHQVRAAEVLFHCAVVCAVNSTMLLEGALMGRHAIGLHYLSFPALFAPAEIPQVKNRDELDDALSTLEERCAGLSAQGRRWAADTFSCGVFDGRSQARIHAELHDLARPYGESHALTASAHLFVDSALGASSATAALHRTPTPAMAHLEALLGFRRYLHAPPLAEAQVADVFVKWGSVSTPAKRAQDELATALGRPTLVVEDGFLRSRELGLKGAPGLSIIVDTVTAYYDTTRASRLETRLNSAAALTPVQRERAQRCMREIGRARLSKYNHAPDTRKVYTTGEAILLVDQRRGDASVAGALANAESFRDMLRWAFVNAGSRRILVKRHPDAISGGKGSYFGADDALLRDARVTLIDSDVNPHTLFDQVTEVCVVASGMGFEAALAGLRVRTFGAPFYAGWGVTTDMVAVPRRARTRTVVELFHYAYIEASRYYSERLGRRAEIEDILDELAATSGAAS